MNRKLGYVVVALLGWWTASASAEVSLATWDFEAPNTPADAIDMAVYPNPVVASSGRYAGTSIAGGTHASALTDWTTPAGNGSVDSFSSNNWAVGDYYQFRTSSLGRSDISVGWDQTSSGTGPRDFVLQYSTDGTTYTQFGGTHVVLFNGTPNNFWSVGNGFQAAYHFSVDLSSVTALDNQPSIYFRLANDSTTNVNGGAIATGGANRVDNFVVIPEPATMTLLGLGGLFLARMRRRR